jgi:hypothetical protein
MHEGGSGANAKVDRLYVVLLWQRYKKWKSNNDAANSKKSLKSRYQMKTVAIMIVMAIFVSFALVQNVSYGQKMPSFTTNSTVNVNGTNLTIPYSITNGKLISINTDLPSKSLIVLIQSTEKGTLNLTLPRILIDAKQVGGDTHYIVLINNHGTNYAEIESYTSRTLSIPFPLGAEKILVIGTQMLTQISNQSSSPPQVIQAPSTDSPPDIDGKWTTPSEWNTMTATELENNGSKMYVLALHDSNFVYVMADIVSDNTQPSDSEFMRYNLVMIFDRGDYQRDTTLGINEIGVGTSLTFINGTQISNNFGSQVWTYDNQRNAVDIAAPSGYNSSMGFSSANDPFDSSHDHRIYEFRIPISLLNKSDSYGFSMQAHACHSLNLGSQCTPIYLFIWPNGTIMSVPASHGILQLTNEISAGQPVGVTISYNSQTIIEGIIVAAIATAIAVYAVARKRKQVKLPSGQ